MYIEGFNNDDNDGLDIQSLSVVEAEFLYNHIEDGDVALTGGRSDKSKPARTINLDSFQIIKVIGKGFNS